MEAPEPWIIPILHGDTPQVVIRKAANVRPAPRQRAWQELELTAFVHFGINTFTDLEWGTGLEDPAIFDPAHLDTRQWCRELREAGFKQVILTAKHHDGFCLWPSRYTDFSVKRSQWRNGQGDVLRELADAAREFGLKVGWYLSRADLHEIEAPGGRYGNGSPPVHSVIPTLLPGDTRQPTQTFTFTVDDYNRYYLNQLYELLTEYGPVHEVWFDGANPKPGVPETYNYADWFALVRALAPDAVVFNGLDVRWVGNEEGWARDAEWSPLPFRGDPAANIRLCDPVARDLGSRTRLSEAADYVAWYPAEVDVSMRPGWFYHSNEDERVKSLHELLDIYYDSVGRNAVLLLNIPADREGRFAAADVRRLREFGRSLRRTFQRNLAEGAQVTASAARHDGPSSDPACMVDGNPDTYWMSPDHQVSAELVFELPQSSVFNVILLQESLSIGQRVDSFAVDIWLGDSWREIATGLTIGYKRLLRIPDVEARRVRLRILDARLNPAIQTLGLFREGAAD